jgi:uncharacterized membrane-anchored protein
MGRKMKDKQTILMEIRDSLQSGLLQEEDVRALLTPPPMPATTTVTTAPLPQNEPDKLSAVDIMFYIAGIVFFSTIMSIIVQSWDDGNALTHIILSAGVGGALWSIVYYLAKNSAQSDIRTGLSNALLLTGSLLIIVGGYVITNELIGGFGKVNFIPGAVTLGVLCAIHLAFDRVIKKDLTLLLGILLGVATFPTLLFGILQDADVPADIWSFILIISMALLTYATRIVAKVQPERKKIHNAFDAFAAFSAMTIIYIASFGELGVLWLAILIGSVFGIFYLSIVSQNKRLLGTASLFLTLAIITISFKYFSGFGATASLIIATMGLLGTAAIAASINKKYFK